MMKINNFGLNLFIMSFLKDKTKTKLNYQAVKLNYWQVWNKWVFMKQIHNKIIKYFKNYIAQLLIIF